MFNQDTKHRSDQNAIEVVPFRKSNEIARVLLMGNSQVVIYRDKPGHLLFGLFSPAPKNQGY